MTEVASPDTAANIVFIRKPAATTHFENNYTLAERKLINICIGHAQEEGISTREYDMPVADLEYWKVVETRNRKWLEDIVTGVVTKAITWNSFGKDRTEEWGVCTFLASGRIRGGRFKYRLNPELVSRLSNPKVWGRFRLLAQLNITHRHSLVLYEYLGTELSMAGKGVDEIIVVLSVEDLRTLCGLTEGQYPEFKGLNRFVIKPAVLEIYKQTDLEVAYSTKRVNRRVAELVFNVRRKSNFQFAMPGLRLPSNAKATDIAENGVEERFKAVKRLVELGVHEIAAENLATEFDADRIERNVAYAMEQREKGQVTKLAAYIVTAIKADYRPAPAKEELERAAAVRRAAAGSKADAIQAARDAELEKEFAKFKEERTREIFNSRSPEWQAKQRKAYKEELMARPETDIWRQYFVEKGWDHAFVNGAFFGELQKELLMEPHETDLESYKSWKRSMQRSTMQLG